MGRRSKQPRQRPKPQPILNEQTQEEKHDAFARFISDRLKVFDLCSGQYEYDSISEAIAAMAPADAPPTEKDLENAMHVLLEFFDEVADADARGLIFAAALDAWGACVAVIATQVGNSDEGSDGCHRQTDAGENEDTTDASKGDEDADDGDYIGEGECELCERSIKLTRHHLIPKFTWPRVKKRLWNAATTIESLQSLSSQINKTSNDQRREEMKEKQKSLQDKLVKIFGPDMDLSGLPATVSHDNIRAYLCQVCLLCRGCHSAIHRIHTEWELATEFNTMDRLLQCEEVMKYGKWANKQRC